MGVGESECGLLRKGRSIVCERRLAEVHASGLRMRKGEEGGG